MKKFEANKAVLSCSGGLDSSMLLLKLLAEGKSVRCYSFNYGQKHVIELEKIKKNIEFLKSKGLPVEHQIVDVTDIFSGNTSSLVASTGKGIPHGHYAAENMKSTVVPLRNVIFSAVVYSKAINWAVETGENVMISLGIHAGDTPFIQTVAQSHRRLASMHLRFPIGTQTRLITKHRSSTSIRVRFLVRD